MELEEITCPICQTIYDIIEEDCCPCCLYVLDVDEYLNNDELNV
jgi:hypothetical protein